MKYILIIYILLDNRDVFLSKVIAIRGFSAKKDTYKSERVTFS